ncbi:MAG: helix-turn-helix domain-containing protein [Planctomycetota bacterium]|nr:helix-turn-helix domain-containing protein [Planctomycetota bacterium]MDA1112784.1 helix-turn-helix domain-containing protein [Planctomycetota bacterium]
MQLHPNQSDAIILAEMGKRLAQKRLAKPWSQAELAAAAGVSKRTIERVEAGASIQLANWLCVLRALELIEDLEAWLPESGPSPMDRLRQKRSKSPQRKRVSALRNAAEKPWDWEDKA